MTPFRGRIFHVDRDRVRLSNGRTTTLEIVRHRGSVVLIAQPTRRSIILIRQYRYAIRRWIWELPAGSIDAREGAAHAARRECEEEIGLTPRRLTRLTTLYPTPGFCDEKMIFFRCEQLVTPRRPAHLDEDEQIEPREFSLAEAQRLVARGQIIDMKTVLGLRLVGGIRAGR
jgi:ADP-ribose pyrophosphatase